MPPNETETTTPVDLLRAKVQEAAEKRASMIEIMAGIYLKMCDIPWDEVELVEVRDPMQLRWYFRKKGTV